MRALVGLIAFSLLCIKIKGERPQITIENSFAGHYINAKRIIVYSNLGAITETFDEVRPTCQKRFFN